MATKQIITQAAAGRLRGVSRERIRQLVGKPNGLRQVLSEDGLPVRGKVYLKDVLNLQQGKQGRPKLTLAERIKRNKGYVFSPEEEALWQHVPRDGFGFEIYILARIKKIGNKRIQISFKDAENKIITLWTKVDFLDKIILNGNDR